MSKQNIAPDRRYAIWLAHDQKCWFCREPVSFSETHIDHIVPESLAGREELRAYTAELGLPENFDLFADVNLAPAHSRCNLYKREDKFEPTALIQKVLKDNGDKVERVAAIRGKLLSDKNVANP